MSSYKPPLHLKIPVALPGILKDYTKAVLRNQPDDLYSWSAEYFKQLSEIYGNEKNASDVVEPEASNNAAKNSDERGDGALMDFSSWKSIYAELCDFGTVPFEDLKNIWSNRGFSISQLNELLTVGEFYSGEVDLNKFSGLVCGSLASSLTKTMHFVAMLYSGVDNENDTKGAKIQYTLFESIYTFMASLDDEVPPSNVKKVLNYLKKISLNYNGFISAKDFLSRFCPKLE